MNLISIGNENKPSGSIDRFLRSERRKPNETLWKGNVFIMGYVTFSLGFYMVCCSVASLAVGYIYLSCSHLYSFASYDRPYALKIMSDVEDVTPANTDFPSSDA